MGQGILLSGETEVDFMIHGVFSYELFGQTVWITRTHVCVLIVMLIIMAFCLFANRAIKRASEVPGAFQNVVELVVEMLDNMIGGVMGRYAVNFRNYIGTIFIFILISNISGLLGLRPPTADYGVTPEGVGRYQGPLQSVADLGTDQYYQRSGRAGFAVAASVCQHSVRNGNHGAYLCAAQQGRPYVARGAARIL